MGLATGAAAAFVPAVGDAVKEHLRRALFIGTPVPDPAGPEAVGFAEMSVAVPAGEVVFDLWYPAAAEGDAGETARALVAALRHPTRAQALVDAPLAPADARRTLVVYHAAGGSTRTDNSLMLASLASHGYIVAALDDPSHHPLPPGETDQQAVRSSLDYSGDAALDASLQRAGRRTELAAATSTLVIDELARTAPFAEAIDFTRVGAIGLSFGGGTAVALAHADERIAAVVNLDGSTYGAAGAAGVSVPYLFVFSDAALMPADAVNSPTEWIRYEARLTRLEMQRVEAMAERPGHFALVMPDVAHTELGDRLVRPAFSALGKADDRDRTARWEALDTVVRDFLDKNLRNASGQQDQIGPLPAAIVPLEDVLAHSSERGTLAP